MTNPESPMIGIDSDCLSYLIDTIEDVSEPIGDTANEKKSLFRIYLYSESIFFVTPTVEMQYNRIKDVDRRKLHESFSEVVFSDADIHDHDEVKRLVGCYSKYHKDAEDCRILAEAVTINLGVLLTNGKQFRSHLSNRVTSLRLERPSAYWQSLNIPRGDQPQREPHSTNPLSGETWWRW